MTTYPRENVPAGKFVCLLLLVVGTNHAAAGGHPQHHEDFQFALLRYAKEGDHPRESGLKQLAWEVRKRTNVDIALDAVHVDPSSANMFDYPLLVWQGSESFPAFSESSITNLRHFVRLGGTLWIDVSNAQPQGGFVQSVKRELGRMFPSHRLERVSSDHVLYQSYFLLNRHAGRVLASPYWLGITIEHRLAILLTANDLAGAMARDTFGQWEYDVTDGGNAMREMSFRWGINIVMYVLCMDYKMDPVHLPIILKRRR